MRPFTAPLILSLAFLLPSCSIEISGATTVPPRTGPQFQQVFDNPAVLVTTTDVKGTRKVLDTIPLPETQAHHDALVRALDAVETIDSAHLVLLTEAVAIPPRLANNGSMGTVNITNRNGRVFVYSRGEGTYSHVIDNLLIAGAKKLSDVGPQSFGRLITVTQKVETVVALSDILLDRSDSGSTRDLQTILDEIPFSDLRQELCIDVLLPRDRLNGKRTDVAIESMSFDSNRTKLIGAIYKSLDHVDAATLIRHVKLQSFDSGRIKVVELGAAKLSSINGTDALALVQTASFDSGRKSTLNKLTAKLRMNDAAEVLAFIRTNSFDSGRKDTLETLVASGFPPVSGDDLVAFAKAGSFDSGRHDLLKLVAPHFEGGFTRSSASKLLASFSFDSGRMNAVKLFRSELQKLSERDRHVVLREFSMSSDRDKAAGMLIR